MSPDPADVDPSIAPAVPFVEGPVPPPAVHSPKDEVEPSLLTARFAIVMLATLGYFTTQGALLPTVPRYIEDELNGGGVQVGLGVGAMAVSAALLRPWISTLGDTRGRRLLAVGGAAVCGLSILLYTVATTLPLLIGARLLTGVGEAAAFVGLATAAQDLAPDHRRGEAASYFSGGLYAGLAFGPLLGETLADYSFNLLWVAAAACAGVSALAAIGIKDGPRSAPVADRAWLQRDALWPGLVLLLGLIPFTGFASFIALYAEDVGVDDVGPVFLLYGGLVLGVRILGARIPDALGWRRGSTIALWAVTLAILLVAAWGSVASIYVAAVGLAIGMSLMYPSLFTAVMSAAPADERSHAVGTFSLFFDLASGFGAAIVGLVVSLSSERGGFAAAGLFAIGGIGVQWLLRDRIGRPSRPRAVTGGDVTSPKGHPL